MSYSLPPLQYSYLALEPHIDSETMNLHHSKHHAAYVNNLNKLLSDVGIDITVPIEEFVSDMKSFQIPDSLLDVVKFNAGGHCNHSFFWNTISPNIVNFPQENLLNLIMESFGSLDDFKKAFAKVAMLHLGSGWAWLCVDPSKSGKDRLFVCSTLNHDNPMMIGFSGRIGVPILTLDLWEHAYYLKYNNRKSEFIDNFWKIVNWNKVAECYDLASSAQHG